MVEVLVGYFVSFHTCNNKAIYFRIEGEKTEINLNTAQGYLKYNSYGKKERKNIL